MRITLHILGADVLALNLTCGQDDPTAELGPPFGFSGSSMVQAERAEDWSGGDADEHARHPRR